ncbi:phospho-N-acetylmuramoyl-pentapeptide-transferase, partial [Listeria monocytogenes]|nr:phospho-N-acetylmuramoyl-pentapeptide-transferase [Listeria monocytogenes]
MEWTEMILPLASGFAIVTATMPLFIGYFQMKKYGQEIRGDGPKW